MQYLRYFLVIAILGYSSAHSQNALTGDPLEYQKSFLWSGGTNAVLEGNIAYVSMTNGLMGLDISNPSDPKVVSEVYLQDGYATDLCVQNNRAYVTTWGGSLYVIDLVTYNVIGDFQTPASAYGIDVSGNTAYVAYGSNGSKGMLVLDVSNPADIKDVGTFPTSSVPLKLKSEGNTVYMVGGGLWIVDVTDPQNPAEVTQFQTSYYSIDVVLRDTLLFIADSSPDQPASSAALTIVNVADRTNPVLLKSMDFFGNVTDVDVYGNVASITNDGFVRTIDVSDPGNPAELGEYQVRGIASKVAVANGLVFSVDIEDEYTGPDNFQLLDISSPDNPVPSGRLDLNEKVTGVVCGKDCAFAIGSTIRSISPGKSFQESSYVTAGTVEGAELDGDTLLAASDNGLEVIDVSDPGNMKQLRIYNFPGTDVVFRNNYIFLAGTGIQIFDVSDSSSLPVRSLQTGDMPVSMVLHDDYLYVAARYAGGEVYNVSDPANAFHVKTFGSSTYNDADISGTRLYMKTPNSFHIYDISDPENPVKVGTYNGTPEMRSIMALGDYVVIADGRNGIKVVDVSDPADPTVSYSVETPGYATGMFATDKYLFVADKYSMIEFSNGIATGVDEPFLMPETFSLSQNYPNPFNPTTTISFMLSKPSCVRLSVYNVIGQEVDVLVSGPVTSGVHEVEWDASGFASGLYIYRLVSDDGSVSRKMLFLK